MDADAILPNTEETINSVKPGRALELAPPYRRTESFLGEPLVERLLAHACAHESAFVSTRVDSRNENGRYDETVRASRALRDFGDLRSELETRFENAMHEAQHALGLSGIRWTHLELQLVAHGDGARFLRHIDTSVGQPDTKSFRALSGVYYFHRQPKGFGGGILRLHPLANAVENSRLVDIVPDNDSFVVFPSWFPHEVLPVSCVSGEWLDSRFAINCWYWATR